MEVFGFHADKPRFSYTNHPPFKAYGVEGWWLDNLLKCGKLSRKTYLKLAAQVTVGFQKRLADCKAAERYLHDEALRDAIASDAKSLEPATLPMKRFAVVEVGLVEKRCTSNLAGRQRVCLKLRSLWLAMMGALVFDAQCLQLSEELDWASPC